MKMLNFKNYKIKKLVKDDELADFVSGYNLAYSTQRLKNKHSLLVENLKQYDFVLGVYKGDKMVAGFIVNHFPYRCLESLSEEQVNLIINKMGDRNKLSEVVAIWKSPLIRRATLWTILTFVTLYLGKKYIFGCAYQGHGMTKNYYLLKPKFVVNGKKEDDLEIFYYTKAQFFAVYFLGFLKHLGTKKINIISRAST